MLTYADVFWCVLAYADACFICGAGAELGGQAGPYADVFWRMLTYSGVC
jgi:hypothetical protein